MNKIAFLTLILGLSFMFPYESDAHHSVPVNHDMTKDIEVTGVIVKTKWVNPHSVITLEVTNDDGEVENWLVVMNAHNTIRRLGKKLGWSVDEFVVGETLTAGGWPGRDGNALYFRRATLASGKKIIWESRLDLSEQTLE